MGEPDQEEVAMLDGKTRISPVDVETLPADLRAVLEEQRKRFGAPLYPSSSMRVTRRTFAPRTRCGPPSSRRRSACPGRSGGSSTDASPRGTAASSDRTPTLP